MGFKTCVPRVLNIITDANWDNCKRTRKRHSLHSPFAGIRVPACDKSGNTVGDLDELGRGRMVWRSRWRS
eukprot:12937250-Prorocentrum_lima.AAC.1